MKSLPLFCLFLTLIFSLSASTAFAEKAPTAPQKQLDTLLEATEENDLEAFHSVCDATMKAAITETLLTQLNTQLSGLLKKGYKTLYFGSVQRVGYQTYYWKIDFTTEGTPEMLAELSISKDLVSGFYIK